MLSYNNNNFFPFFCEISTLFSFIFISRPRLIVPHGKFTANFKCQSTEPAGRLRPCATPAPVSNYSCCVFCALSSNYRENINFLVYLCSTENLFAQRKLTTKLMKLLETFSGDFYFLCD
jgi:hypothetical protein